MSKTGLKVFAPATVANVAVGYDILGFAIDEPGDEIIIKHGKEPGIKITKITGAKQKLPYEVASNCAGYAAQKVLDHLGESDRPFEIELYKKMGLGTGMGSSAASAVAGAMAVNEMLGRPLTKRQLLPFAVAGEEIADGAYHADNVAPSLLGGVTLIRDNATLDVHKIHVPKGIYITMIHPQIEILTKDSRAVLSDKVGLEQTIAQTGNIAGFVLGMFNSNFDLIKRSLTDHIIEPQRAQLIPQFYKMKEEALTAGALGFSISGAGPSMFAFCSDSLAAENIMNAAYKVYNEAKIECSSFVTRINEQGALRL